MENIPTSNIMKDTFGWEVPVETVPLPSKGELYSETSGLKGKATIQIKAMTANEEDILLSQAYIKEGTVIEKLIESCVTSNINVDDLILGDKNALMISIRITGYGQDYNVYANCPYCNHKNDVCVDLTGLPIRRMKIQPVKIGQNIFSFQLPVTKKTVHFRFTDGHVEKERDIIKKKYKALGINKENNITGYLESVILSIDGVEDKNKITHFIKNMPARDSKELRKFITENEPGIDMKWEYQCQSCNANNQINIPITPEFFWPNT